MTFTLELSSQVEFSESDAGSTLYLVFQFKQVSKTLPGRNIQVELHRGTTYLNIRFYVEVERHDIITCSLSAP